MKMSDDTKRIESIDGSPSEINFPNSVFNHSGKENLFRDSLQQSGCARHCEPIFVMTRKILEEKFSREIFSRRSNSYM
jgi:hypothetical protein